MLNQAKRWAMFGDRGSEERFCPFSLMRDDKGRVGEDAVDKKKRKRKRSSGVKQNEQWGRRAVRVRGDKGETKLYKHGGERGQK